jgi:predicted dehydrogenase
MTGNALIMLSHKDSAPTIGDFDQQITVESVVQYNWVSKESDTGYITFFEFRGKDGSAILYPGETFSTLSVRTKASGPFVSYVIAHRSDITDLKKEGLYDRQLESQRRLLAKQYAGLARGLDH